MSLYYFSGKDGNKKKSQTFGRGQAVELKYNEGYVGGLKGDEKV
jgi:hypothetical protein